LAALYPHARLLETGIDGAAMETCDFRWDRSRTSRSTRIATRKAQGTVLPTIYG